MEKISLEALLTRDIRGKVICFPTDTVYGVGAMVDDEAAIARIFELKKRDANKPLAILCSSMSIESYVERITPEARRLMEEYWPGALTLIFKRSASISPLITKGVSTIAFRMPNCEVSLRLIDHFGLLATTSVNISGEVELNDIADIEAKFGHEIDYIVTDPATFSRKPSKIIDVSGDELKVIRA